MQINGVLSIDQMLEKQGITKELLQHFKEKTIEIKEEIKEEITCPF